MPRDLLWELIQLNGQYCSNGMSWRDEKSRARRQELKAMFDQYYRSTSNLTTDDAVRLTLARAEP